MRATVRGPPRAGGWNARRELEHDSKDSSTTGVLYGTGGAIPDPSHALTQCAMHACSNYEIQIYRVG